MLFVFLKQFSDYGSLLVVLFRSLNLVLVQQLLIEFLNVMVCGNRHKEIPTVRADLILNIAFLPVGLGIAEPNLESIMGAEPGEQFGFNDLFADPAADAGGIVEYQQLRNPADIFEDVFQSLADTFSCFTAKDLTETVIAVRK